MKSNCRLTIAIALLLSQLCQRNYQVQFGSGTFTFIVVEVLTNEQPGPKQFSLDRVMPIFLLASANEPKTLFEPVSKGRQSVTEQITKQFQCL